MTSEVVFMALEMIIDPRGMAARGAAGTMPQGEEHAEGAGGGRAAPRPGRSSRRPAPACPGPPDVRVAVPIITARTTGVSQPWPPKTKSSTKPDGQELGEGPEGGHDDVALEVGLAGPGR